MSSTIDEKVIRLKLESGQLQSGIQGAVKSLKSLNESVKMDGLKSGLSNIKSSLSNLGSSVTSGLGDSVQQATAKFPMLETAAAVALGNVATKAISTGASLVKSLALDGIMDGFREYELQLNSVQTILANTKSKGETIDTVNASLDELNTYADKTIYNFAEMTRNIGTFTAAGVGLKDSTAAIKGISNLAAASGSSSTQAATAMYQLSQALAAGTVKLMDWNSVVNAGMGGEQFQEALKRTARAHGVAVDEIIKEQGSFRDSLSKGWLSAEIMIETLTQMTGDLSDAQLKQMGYTDEQIKEIQEFAQSANDAATKYKTFTQVMDATKEAIGSGWAKTWQLLMGDFQQAQALWTPIGNAIGAAVDKMSDARNNVIKAFVDAGGRTAVLNTLLNIFKAITKPLAAIGKAFGQVFSGPNGASIAKIAQYIEKLAASFIMSDKNASNLTKTFVGIFSIIKALITPIGWVIKIVAALGYALIRVANWAINNIFLRAILGITRFIEPVGKALAKFMDWLDPIGRVVKLFSAIIKGAGLAFEGFKSVLSGAGFGWLFNLGDAFTKVGDTIKSKVEPIINTIKNFFTTLKEKIPNPFEKFSVDGSNIALMIGGGLATGLLKAIEAAQKLGSAISSKALPYLQRFWTWVKSVASDIRSMIPDSVIDSIKKIGDAFATLGDADWSFGDSFAAIRDGFKSLGSSLSDFTGIKIDISIEGIKSKLEELKESIQNFSGIDIDSIIEKIKAKFQELKNSISDFFSDGEDPTADLGQSMGGGLGTAVAVTQKSKGKLQTIAGWFRDNLPKYWETAKERISQVANWFKTEFPKYLSKGAEMVKKAGSKIAEGLKSIGSSFSDFLKTSDGTQMAGLFAQGFSLGAIVALVKTLKDAISGTGLGEIGKAAKEALESFSEGMEALQTNAKANLIRQIAFAVIALALAMMILASVPPANLGAAFGSLVGGLTAIAGVFKVISGIEAKPKKMVQFGVAMLAMTAALMLMAKAVSVAGGMDPQGAIQGTIVVGALAAMLVAMTKMLKNASGLKITTAIAMVGMVGALYLAAKAVERLGSIPQETLMQGLFATVVLGTLATLFAQFGAQNINVGTAIGMLGMAASLYLVALVVQKFGSMEWEAIKQGIFAFAIVVGAIGLLLLAASQADGLSAAATLLATAISLLIIANVLQQFAMMGWAEFLSGAIMMGVGLAMIGVALALFETQLTGAAALIGVSVAILALAIAIRMLSAIPFSAAASGLAILAMGLLILVAAAFAAQMAAPGFLVLAVGALALGVALLIGAVAVTLFAAALLPLSAGIAALVGSLMLLGSAAQSMSSQLGSMLALAGTLAVFGAGLLVLGAGALVAGAGFLVLGAALLVLGIGLTMITASAPSAGIAIKSFIDSLANLGIIATAKATAAATALAVMGAELLIFGVGALAAGAGALIMTAGLMAAVPALTLFGPLLTRLKTSMSGMAETATQVTTLGTAFQKLGTASAASAASIQRIPTALGQIQSRAAGATTSMTQMGSVTSSSFVKMGVSSTVFSTQLASMVTQVSARMTLLGTVVTTASTRVGQGFTRMTTLSLSALTAFSQNIVSTSGRTTSAMALLATAVNSGAARVGVGFTQMSARASSAFARFRAAVQTGAAGATSGMARLTSAINSNTNRVSNLLVMLGARTSAAMSRFTSAIRSGVSAAVAAMGQLPRGIQNGANGAVSAARSAANGVISGMVSTLRSGAGSVYSAAYAVGANVSQGITNGIAAGRSGAISAAANVASAALSAAKAKLDIHSPSREFYKIGEFVDQGFVNGMNDGTRGVMSAASKMSEAALNSANEILDGLDPSLSPTIVPVLDLSQVRKEAEGIDGLFKTPEIIPSGDVARAGAITMTKSASDSAKAEGKNSGDQYVFNYTQNNTSPKALDALTIYKDTKRQMRQVKRELKRL